MLARRLLLVAALLFFVAALMGAAARPRDAQQAVAPPRDSTAAPEPPQVEGALPADKVVRARVGDLVSITVRPTNADKVVVEDLGVGVDASTQVPGLLEVVADRPGRFPVIGEATNETLGTLEVEPAG